MASGGENPQNRPALRSLESGVVGRRAVEVIAGPLLHGRSKNRLCLGNPLTFVFRTVTESCLGVHCFLGYPSSWRRSLGTPSHAPLPVVNQSGRCISDRFAVLRSHGAGKPDAVKQRAEPGGRQAALREPGAGPSGGLPARRGNAVLTRELAWPVSGPVVALPSPGRVAFTG